MVLDDKVGLTATPEVGPHLRRTTSDMMDEPELDIELTAKKNKCCGLNNIEVNLVAVKQDCNLNRLKGTT